MFTRSRIALPPLAVVLAAALVPGPATGAGLKLNLRLQGGLNRLAGA